MKMLLIAVFGIFWVLSFGLVYCGYLLREYINTPISFLRIAVSFAFCAACTLTLLILDSRLVLLGAPITCFLGGITFGAWLSPAYD